MRIRIAKPWSDAWDAAISGYVRAERINDVIAKPDSKRFQDYMRLVKDQFAGEPVVDPDDEYRDRELVPRALDAYEIKHPEADLRAGRIYYHDQFPIVASPDAVDAHTICITVHIRRSLRTWKNAVEAGVTDDMRRVSIAQLRITGMAYAKHLDYFEDARNGIRKLHEHRVSYDHQLGEELENALIRFAMKTRFKAQAEAAA